MSHMRRMLLVAIASSISASIAPPATAAETLLAGGGSQSLARTAGGAVWVWGYRGRGAADERAAIVRPVRVEALRDIAAGSFSSQFHVLALLRDGSVRACGWNFFGQLGDGTDAVRAEPVVVERLHNAVAVAAGADFSLALAADGGLWASGWNRQGQLGDGTTETRLAPVRVRGLSGVRAIAAGFTDAFAVTAEGRAWTWGRSYVEPATHSRATPRMIPGL